MTPMTALLITLAYVAVLLGVSRWSSRRAAGADSESRFFVAGQQAPWFVVAFGMVGASLSGVTFLSIPGWVRDQEWTYMQMVFGYCIGYLIVATVLLPLYYKLKLTSIYGYLGERFGRSAHKTGAAFFLLSRVIGASFRLFLVALVIDVLILEPVYGGATPWTWFGLTTAGILAVIYLYTRRSGMATVIWTDTLQTACMLLAVILTVGGILAAGGHSWLDLPEVVASTDLTKVWVTDDWKLGNHWAKHILAGMFVTIAMTGLDQDMMQKNLACRNLREAQWNMGTFTVILVGANLLFLTMGSLLWMHAERIGMALPEATDRLYPLVAMGGSLGPWLGVAFVVGLLASAFSSADSALTALTTSTCVDVIDTAAMDHERATQTRQRVHLGMTVVLCLVILAFRAVNDTSVVAALFTVANYTYGPLLGLFAVGMFTTWTPRAAALPWVCVAAPVLGYGLEQVAMEMVGFSFGFALLPVNGLLTALGLGAISRPQRG
ncbi:MAG: sodium:solute symporter [Bacteroidetes bacterium]|nr:sodium:solute symporter [Bacteroidota bacterium]